MEENNAGYHKTQGVSWKKGYNDYIGQSLHWPCAFRLFNVNAAFQTNSILYFISACGRTIKIYKV